MKEIKYKILRSRKAYPVPVFWNIFSHVSKKTKQIHGIDLNRAWFCFIKGKGTTIYQEKDWNKAGQYILNRFLNNKNYIKKVFDQQSKTGKELVQLSQKILLADLSKVSIKSLFNLYLAVYRSWLKHDQYNVLPWFVGGDFLSNYIYQKLKSLNPNFKDGDFIILTTPLEKSFSADEELDVLKLTLKLKMGKLTMKSKEARRQLIQLKEKYYWIPFGYDGPTIYDLNHYVNVIKDLLNQKVSVLKNRVAQLKNYTKILKKKQEKVRKFYLIPADLWQLIKYLQTLAILTDQRKKFTFPSHVAFDKVLKEISKRLKINIKSLKYLTLEELKKHYQYPQKLIKKAAKRKGGSLIFFAKQNKVKVFENKQANNLIKRLLPKIRKVKIITGIVGSRGDHPQMTGKVKILFSPQEINKIKKGDILVTAMTSPEFMPAMRKASAIITDEGGVTCHAAIVSRELGIPCIIGTKIATKILKDGDKIEVNATKGIVKKLK